MPNADYVVAQQSIADTEESEESEQALGPLRLTVFGTCVIIGIFVLTGEAAGEKRGPRTDV